MQGLDMEINTEIDRHTTGAVNTRLWSIQAPIVRVDWKQVKRWALIFMDQGLDRCRVDEVQCPAGKNLHTLKEFRRTCNTEFRFQQLEFMEDWTATLYQLREPLTLPFDGTGVTRLLVVLTAEARFTEGGSLARTAVHLYSPDGPLGPNPGGGERPESRWRGAPGYSCGE